MDTSTIPYALVVDDDPLILMLTCEILEEAGFRCHEARDGDEAIQLLGKHSQSVILLFSDVEMRGRTDGFALARHVARAWPHIEIVIASGRLQPGPGDMPEGAAFISKPFNCDMVHTHLREKLPNGKQPEPLKHSV